MVEAPHIDVVFVLDTTGSMSGLIEGAKQKIWSIATDILDTEVPADIRFGLVGYRDRGDAYVTRNYELTDDIHHIYGHLLDFKAQGGGDHPESVNQALHEAIHDFDWDKNAKTLRLVFLVGNAPPHMDYAQDVKYYRTAEDALDKDIVINTLLAGNNQGTRTIWKEIEQLIEKRETHRKEELTKRGDEDAFDLQVQKWSVNKLQRKALLINKCQLQSLNRLDG